MNRIHGDRLMGGEKERQLMTDDGFTSVIHELRSPLTSVRSLSEILQDYPEINGKKRREFLDIIIHETRRMTGIIQQADTPARSLSDSVKITR
jgi:signal transduction histidine kinase